MDEKIEFMFFIYNIMQTITVETNPKLNYINVKNIPIRYCNYLYYALENSIIKENEPTGEVKYVDRPLHCRKGNTIWITNDMLIVVTNSISSTIVVLIYSLELDLVDTIEIPTTVFDAQHIYAFLTDYGVALCGGGDGMYLITLPYHANRTDTNECLISKRVGEFVFQISKSIKMKHTVYPGYYLVKSIQGDICIDASNGDKMLITNKNGYNVVKKLGFIGANREVAVFNV